MRITSAAFENNQFIPTRYTCKGANINPPLEFHGIPVGAKSLVLMLEDIDAPANPWVHWLVFNIPIASNDCAENGLPNGATEGLANGGSFGYEGPCPKYFSGKHQYLFRLYALDIALSIPNESDRSQVLAAMTGHVLAEAHLVGLAQGEQVTAPTNFLPK